MNVPVGAKAYRLCLLHKESVAFECRILLCFSVLLTKREWCRRTPACKSLSTPGLDIVHEHIRGSGYCSAANNRHHVLNCQQADRRTICAMCSKSLHSCPFESNNAFAMSKGLRRILALLLRHQASWLSGMSWEMGASLVYRGFGAVAASILGQRFIKREGSLRPCTAIPTVNGFDILIHWWSSYLSYFIFCLGWRLHTMTSWDDWCGVSA